MSESTVDPKKKSAAIAKTASKSPAAAAAPKNKVSAPKTTPPAKPEVIAKPSSAPAKPSSAKTAVTAEKKAATAVTAQSASAPAAKPKSPRKTVAAKTQVPNQDAIDKMVAEAAYYLAEKRNFATGFEEEDWLAAKKQIMAQLKGAKKPQG